MLYYNLYTDNVLNFTLEKVSVLYKFISIGYYTAKLSWTNYYVPNKLLCELTQVCVYVCERVYTCDVMCSCVGLSAQILN